jgi:hypothetical protein
VRWNFTERGIRREPIHTGTLPSRDHKTIHQAPIAAAISPHQSLLAPPHRGQPIICRSLEGDAVLGLCGRDVGSKTPNISVQTALFNLNSDSGLLVAAYQDGELALYDA